ncbi:hypothetical protein JCM4914_20010 [Streptomyces platensis subsp. malvinus]
MRNSGLNGHPSHRMTTRSTPQLTSLSAPRALHGRGIGDPLGDSDIGGTHPRGGPVNASGASGARAGRGTIGT